MAYSVYKTKQNYYAMKFRDPVTGAYGTEKRIDALKKKLGEGTSHVKTSTEAHRIARLAEDAGFGYPAQDSEMSSKGFGEFVLRYWDWDTSCYIMHENTINPGSIGKDYAKECYNTLKNHVVPHLPKDLRCSQVSGNHIMLVQNHVMMHNSIYTWKHVLTALARPVSELLKHHVISSNPLSEIDKLKLSCHRKEKRGALDSAEMSGLMKCMDRHSQAPYRVTCRIAHTKGKRAGQEYDAERYLQLDRRVFLATALSGYGGLRLGEVLALRINCIKVPENIDITDNDPVIVEINEAFARQTGFKCPKNREKRKTTIPKWLADELQAFGSENPWHEALYSKLGRHQCVDQP